MGIASWALGDDNPFSKYVADNRQTLQGAFAGFGQGPTFAAGLGNAALGAQRGTMLDDITRKEAAELAKAEEQTNVTRTWLEQQGYTDLVPLVDAGQAGLAYSEALKRMQPGYGSPDLTADMQNFQFAQQNPDFASFMGGSGEAPQIVETYDPETGQPVKGYMQGTTFVPVGGPKQASARDNPMNATIQKEIFEADESVQAGEAVLGGLTRALELNSVAYDGPFADQRSAASALFGDQGGIATQELKNVVTAQALESLKAVFGGMPTEGERKILLEIQGSVDQPKPVREAIYKRAMAAAERRIAANQAKADALRSGTYFDPGFSQQQAPGGQTSTGLQWSIEP